MFDKTIKIMVGKNGDNPMVLTNEEVKDLWFKSIAKLGTDLEMLEKMVELQERLNAANAKLKQYGHISEF